ncbi:hypothetical protein [Kitasatospora sp. NPDC005856]|uniref:hypothetical protein n=1 Tax=Kitasatospora sp. NPDC005856 TaxID=3154566 RepID=UPI00340A734A
MTINQKLFRQGLLATAASTLTALAAAAAQAAPAQRDDGPLRYRVSVRAAGAWVPPPGLASFTVHIGGTGGEGGPGDATR